VILWDIATGEPIQHLNGHKSFIHAIAFSPDGSLLASGGCGTIDVTGACNQGEVLFWDPATGERVGQPLTGHARSLNDLAFSPDGKLLATASTDKNVIIWDVATGQQVGQRLAAHKGPAASVAFSPDGSTLASGGYGEIQGYQYINGEIAFWDVASGQRLGEPLIALGAVSEVAFRPDGRQVASVSSLGTTGTVILWDADLDSWKQRACQVANRNLTPEEWTQIFGEEPYRETCPGLGPE
jgi:WD40 repeat protein